MFTFWFTFDSKSDSFYNLIVLIFTISSISFMQLERPSLLSRFEITNTKAVKTISINWKNTEIRLGGTKNSIKKNKEDRNKTLYLNIAKIVNEWIMRLIKDIFEGCTYLLPLMQGMLSNAWIVFFNVPE